MRSSLLVIQRKMNIGFFIFTSRDFAARSVMMAVPEIAKINIDPMLFDREAGEAANLGALAEFLDSVIDEVRNIKTWIFDEWLSQKFGSISRIHRGDVHGNLFSHRLKFGI